MAARSEFLAPNAYPYDRRSPVRWIVSHIWRYRLNALLTSGCFIGAWLAYASAQVMIGQAAERALSFNRDGLLWLAGTILLLLIADACCILTGGLSAETIAANFEADAREELYGSLLGKSKTFHDRQRAGDIMARATDDSNQLSNMVVPGLTLMYETVLGIIVPIGFIVSLKPELALVPLLFVASYILIGRRYIGRLSPVIDAQRGQFGKMNAALEETVSGIEVVKASGREQFERMRFFRNARAYRDLFVQQGELEARYLPLLFYGLAVGGTFLHTMLAFQAGRVGLGQVIGTMGLVGLLRFPTFVSIFAISLVQLGISSARRILAIINAETDLDERADGHRATIAGDIVFEDVSFGYSDADGAVPGRVLQGLSFAARAGQTVAVVGQTGSGKSALTQMINRTYDVSAGRVLVDGIDVRDWSLDTLRSQIAKIEQDVFLFSRSIRDNIAFGDPGASMERIEAAARAAQAHEFILELTDGYDTVVGERGTTLSGGQRQRVALARAFLSDPRIMILDDSTSAIDSATEDQIQRALRTAQEGRTTIMITHRLAQIRWADLILLLDGGRIVAQGTHDELMATSNHYRRIFARVEQTSAVSSMTE